MTVYKIYNIKNHDEFEHHVSETLAYKRIQFYANHLGETWSIKKEEVKW